jgi:hypothetical protein
VTLVVRPSASYQSVDREKNVGAAVSARDEGRLNIDDK